MTLDEIPNLPVSSSKSVNTRGRIRRSYLRFYDRPALWAPLVFLWDSFRLGTPNAPRSFLNRMKDYCALFDQSERRWLHRSLQKVLEQQSQSWESYDYGEGYFYQGLKELGISGLRNSEARVEAMDLLSRVEGCTVLEIGCNTGFLSVLLSRKAARVAAFDINPHLVEIGRIAAQALQRTNVTFFVSRFEDLQLQETFDVVLSFANHSTFDENTAQNLHSYFQRCHQLLRPGGSLLFESHPPQYEGAKLGEVLNLLRQTFELQEQRLLVYPGGPLDLGRTFVVAKRLEVGEGA